MSMAYSPIQRLDFDILWCIVQINADMFNYDEALETTLATSRVCRDWRNFMLSTTSIWAHLIDLDHWVWSTAEGRSEFIRRSGTALLWMKLHDMYGPLHCNKHLLNVVGKHLERIQRLEVTITLEYVDQWSLLFFPAPHLESFSITFDDRSRKFNHILSSLFGGSAPLLRELYFRGHRSNLTTAPSSWLHQLRSLDLEGEPTVSKTLGVLTLTTNLVNLWLYQIRADRTTPTLSLVSLPKLAYLDMHLHTHTATLTSGAVLLDHLRIPPICSLNLLVHSIHRRAIDEESTCAAIIRAISTCARASFTHHAPQNLCLTITPRHFTLETTTHPDGPTFRFSMELLLQQVFPKHTLPILLSEFSLPYFSKVTSFRVRISSVNRPVPEIPTFMACLPSVNTIKTDKWSLRHLIRAPVALKRADTGPRILFPTLKILDVRSLLSSRADKSRFDSYPDPVSKFVLARIAHDHAISIIDFTEDTLDVLPNMEFLRKAVGLEVCWRQRGVPEIHKYVCGTRAPPNPVSVQEVDSVELRKCHRIASRFSTSLLGNITDIKIKTVNV
ncbi:hypothetical protein HYPSUDRAFT_204641 [Hypholoma sublateritium FD-334 SS-4]|uniref:F-box domain-containing protein n=1 Tax=Hypholoma sublateritium (strain FD-334 SS-4) TaxID=945553 RepID=A0A0D2NRV7_HYPSF|nr:hypothetical protein HYPSUDRAFT_204641 [Hypholoma sublateritium FD-334 SS-4]